MHQRLFELRQAALRQQRGVAVDLGHQPLLRRYRENVLGRQIQRIGDASHLLRDLGIDIGVGTQAIPQTVDLVEDDDATLVPAVSAIDMVAPHRHVGLVTPVSPRG